MKLKINFKKIMAAFMLIVVICSTFIGDFNTVYGRINEYYTQGQETGKIDLDKASDDSTILEHIGYFVYAIAGFIESIVGGLIGSFTGEDIFPWADRIIFNTIPFLDVNFLSPANGSMFRNSSGVDTMFGDIIGNIYYTIFTISVAFFGVVVGIMALKLAISSIASEKAKYKEAITNWVLALIMLFTTHYLISFIFFVNEKMVEVASSILKTQIEANIDEIKLDLSINQSESDLNNTFNRFFVAYYNGVEETVESLGEQEDVYCLYNLSGEIGYATSFEWIKLVTIEDNDDNDEFNYKFFINHSKDIKNYKTLYQFSGTGTNWSNTNNATTSLNTDLNAIVENKFKLYLAFLLTDVNYLKDCRIEIKDLVDSSKGWFHEFDVGTHSALRDMRRVANDALFLTNIDPQVLKVKDGSFNEENITFWVDQILPLYCDYMETTDNSFGLDGSTNYGDECEEYLKNIYNKVNSNNTYDENKEEATTELLSGIANFFKGSIYSVSLNYQDEDYQSGEEEFVDIKFQPIIAILYAIFVIQSIMYFIAYMKRFFYIVILAMFAPLVIIYDFLMKSAM